jgi:antitoxin YefM
LIDNDVPRIRNLTTIKIAIILAIILIFHPMRRNPMQIDSYVPVTKAKNMLLDMIRMIDDQENTIAITRNGVPKAVLMSMEQYEAMRETMAILGDPDLMKQIRDSHTEIKEKNPLVDLEDLL